ncbi:ICOS ligand-like isoform X2 [Stegostoma tigrinum]|uniref:ICOS ligand-like isoform X2 n=1 Tax=Stegostoma tigrinum TaxID=3053191 RepID=UPI00202B5E3D|nr:ICOS ligand-like isoform X2 [Stegostoma tigrinum]
MELSMMAFSLSLCVMALGSATATSCDGVQELNMTGPYGGEVILPCYLTEAYRAYWQTEAEDRPALVNAFCHEEVSGCDSISAQYINRSCFVHAEKSGNFSLRLWDLRPRDEMTYQCVLQSQQRSNVKCYRLRLSIEAQGSQPNMHVAKQRQGQETVLTCSVTGIYPKPEVKWLNETDNSELPLSLVHTKAENRTDERYNVKSTLRLEPHSMDNITCQIINNRSKEVIWHVRHMV